MSSPTIASAIDPGDGKIQQDCIRYNDTTIVVCDGHGEDGHLFANSAADFLIAAAHADLLQLFADATAHVHAALSIHPGGSTCTYVKIHPTRALTVANLGDSAVRYWDAPGAGTLVTADHSPCSLEEFVRVTALGGRCLFSNDGHRYRSKEPTFVPAADGSFRFNVEGVITVKNCHHDPAAYLEAPATVVRLAVTRAFGNYALIPYGLSTIPAVNMVPPPPEGVRRAVVIASDGLWDVMSNESIGAIVCGAASAESAAATLLTAALAAGRALFGAPVQDNTTVAVVYL
jgi:serine/threonine protein phosphatase PrpC